MATAQDIIDAAYRKIGHRDPTSTDQSEGLENLNNMLGSWGAELLAPYMVRDEALAVSTTSASYTIGSGGTWDTARPVKPVSAFLRTTDNYDYPITIIAVKEYDEIYSKSESARPEYVYYIAEYPYGKFIFECVPDTTYTFYLSSWKLISELAALATTVSLPNEYKEALVYNLAVTLAEDKGVQLPSKLLTKADELKYKLSNLIAMNAPTPESDIWCSGGVWNITTGEYE